MLNVAIRTIWSYHHSLFGHFAGKFMYVIDKFKNLFIYKVSDFSLPSLEQISASLEKNRVRDPSGMTLATSGWEKISGDNFWIDANGCYFFRFSERKRKIPPRTLKEAIAMRVVELQGKGEPIRKKQIKEDVLASLLPKAFVEPTTIDAYFDSKENLFIVNAASESKASKVSELFRETFDCNTFISLNNLEREVSVSQKLRDLIVAGNEVANIGLGSYVKLEKSDDKSTYQTKNSEIDKNEVEDHLTEGKSVNELEMEWMQGRLSFVVNKDFVIKRIKLDDSITEAVEQNMGESTDYENALIAECIVFTSDVRDLYSDLTKALS